SDRQEPIKWCGADHFLSTWRARAAAGQQPAVIFNATVPETGQRYLITNFAAPDFSRQARKLADIDLPPEQAAVAFDRSFPDHDLRVTTAARLSATFPLVTPVARPRIDDDRSRVFHAADGGYYDNYGVASAIEWLRDAHVEKLLKD